ncbi:MAG: hypothetical protein HY904_21865 [Deltaproteobacteria bacterium]|nr:hypothetical protein [Deltaproteobacteria bacterium]
MLWWIVGGMFAGLGAVMMGRGWNYFLHPEGPRALKRRARNVELGFPTDMRVFGRKVRRMGTILVITGGVLISVPWW